jgi:protein subunit release factor A
MQVNVFRHDAVRPTGRQVFHKHLVMGSNPITATERTNMETIIIEIRAAEGGDDAKLLVVDQMRAYVNVASARCL